MPRLISFSLTEEQFRARTKTVTRRTGWTFLKPGDVLMGCRKTMGLKKGEKVVRLGLIRVVSVRLEWIEDITDEEVALEGFPQWSREDFLEFFLDRQKPRDGLSTRVTRIEFEYL